MDDTLIEIAQNEVGLINEELDMQTEKYMNLQKKLGRGSEVLDRNRALLDKLKKATQMREILKFICAIILVVAIVLGVLNYRTVSDAVTSIIGKINQ